jgi:hypothetical protein
MPGGSDVIAELRAALSGAPGTRSSLHQWMRANHAGVSSLLEEVRPNWRKLADAFARMGLSDGNGRPPRPQTARQTWWRVRRAMAKGKPAPGPEVRELSAALNADDALARLRSELNERSGRRS